MAYEIETKVLDIDLEAIKEKLVSLNAKKLSKNRLVVDWYRLIDKIGSGSFRELKTALSKAVFG